MTTEDDLKRRGWVIVNENNVDGWCGGPGDQVASFPSDDDQRDAEKPTPNQSDVLPTKDNANWNDDKKYPHTGKDGIVYHESIGQLFFMTPRQKGHRVEVSRNAAVRESVHGPKILPPPEQPNIETAQPDNRAPDKALPRCLDDLLSQPNLSQLFPHLSSNHIEEWVQKCKTARDNAYIGEEVKLTILQSYNNFEEERQTKDTSYQQPTERTERCGDSADPELDAFQPDDLI